MTDRELMQQALEALEWCRGEDLAWVNEPEFFTEAITALRERLAQPEQDFDAIAERQLASLKRATRKTTEDAVVRAVLKMADEPEQSPLDRMAENARELGLDYEPVQEPVAWMFEDDEDNGHKTFRQTPPSPEAVAYLAKWNRPAWVPLYTTPPRREWVGLTDDELEMLELKHAPPVHPEFVKDDDWWEFARAIEAKLKEKNSAD